jgi:hypothetical protein
MHKESAEDREQHDQRRRYVDRHAENALERDDEVADQPVDVVAAMRPGGGKYGPAIA